MAWAAAILQLVTTVRATDARCLAHGSRWLTNKSASFACSPGAKNKPKKNRHSESDAFPWGAGHGTLR